MTTHHLSLTTAQLGFVMGLMQHKRQCASQDNHPTTMEDNILQELTKAESRTDFVAVPLEPTSAMLDELLAHEKCSPCSKAIMVHRYRAMVTAAPTYVRAK